VSSHVCGVLLGQLTIEVTTNILLALAAVHFTDESKNSGSRLVAPLFAFNLDRLAGTAKGCLFANFGGNFKLVGP
jgi:hypothetical protein